MTIKLLAVFQPEHEGPFITVPFQIEQGSHIFNELWKAVSNDETLTPDTFHDLIYDEPGGEG